MALLPYGRSKHGAEQVSAYGPVHQLKDMAKHKFRTILRNKVFCVGKGADKDAGCTINVPNYQSDVGAKNFSTAFGHVADGGVFAACTGTEESLNSTSLYTGTNSTGRPSDSAYQCRLPNGFIASAVSAAALIGEVSPAVKKLSGDVMNTCASIDQNIKQGSNDMLPLLFDWQTARGSGSGFIHQPYDLNNEIGNAGMTSNQLHTKFATAIHRTLFLAKDRGLPNGGMHYTHQDVFDLALDQEVFMRIVALAQSPTRTAKALCGLYGIQIDDDLFRRYEITRDDPFHDAVGTLIHYDPAT